MRTLFTGMPFRIIPGLRLHGFPGGGRLLGAEEGRRAGTVRPGTARMKIAGSDGAYWGRDRFHGEILLWNFFCSAYFYFPNIVFSLYRI